MAIIIRLSPRAEEDLDKIGAWYAAKANIKIADRIINNIVESIELLSSHPNLGHIERELESFPQSFRTCIDVPNYKIVYWLEDNIVKIATIFDCRQRTEYLVHIFSAENDWLCEPNPEYQTKTESI